MTMPEKDIRPVTIAERMNPPFKAGDRVRLKGNHAIEAEVTGPLLTNGGFYMILDGSHTESYARDREEWERVRKPMPTLEPGMVVEWAAWTKAKPFVLTEVDAHSVNKANITRVGRVEWIWSKETE
jgi:hypothetical protein